MLLGGRLPGSLKRFGVNLVRGELFLPSDFLLSCTDLVGHAIDEFLDVGGDLGLRGEGLAGEGAGRAPQDRGRPERSRPRPGQVRGRTGRSTVRPRRKSRCPLTPVNAWRIGAARSPWLWPASC